MSDILLGLALTAGCVALGAAYVAVWLYSDKFALWLTARSIQRRFNLTREEADATALAAWERHQRRGDS